MRYIVLVTQKLYKFSVFQELINAHKSTRDEYSADQISCVAATSQSNLLGVN